MSLICFQVVEDGYEFFAKRQLVTLFSAPNYCGEFDNAGAMMSVDETLMCSFQVRRKIHTHPTHFIMFLLFIFTQFHHRCLFFTDSQTCRQEAVLRWWRRHGLWPPGDPPQES